jgi:hypothetical protein
MKLRIANGRRIELDADARIGGSSQILLLSGEIHLAAYKRLKSSAGEEVTLTRA